MKHKERLRINCKPWILGLGILVLTLFPLLGKSTMAEEYPTKTITVICGYSPGGSTDRQIRLLLPFVQKHLGKSIMLENLTGAQGILATNKVFSSSPDGYTLLVASVPTIIIQEKYLPEISRYRSRDLTHIFGVAKEEFVLLSHPELWKSFSEFLRTAPSKRLRVAVAGKGTDSHLRAVILEEIAGVKFNIIPFEGGGPAMTAVAGKHVDGVFTFVSSSSPLVQAETLNALLIFSNQRHPALPQTPTLQEVGLKSLDPMGYFTGIFAPPKLPNDKCKILEEAFAKAVKDPEYIDKTKRMLIDIYPLNSQEFLSLTERQYPPVDKYVQILKSRVN